MWNVHDLLYHLLCGWLLILQPVTIHTLSQNKHTILQLTWVLIVVGVFIKFTIQTLNAQLSESILKHLPSTRKNHVCRHDFFLQISEISCYYNLPINVKPPAFSQWTFVSEYPPSHELSLWESPPLRCVFHLYQALPCLMSEWCYTVLLIRIPCMVDDNPVRIPWYSHVLQGLVLTSA